MRYAGTFTATGEHGREVLIDIYRLASVDVGTGVERMEEYSTKTEFGKSPVMDLGGGKFKIVHTGEIVKGEIPDRLK